MRHCILHIGGHKTGSSAIQQIFMEFGEELERNGVLYPLRGTTTGTQRNLYYELTGSKHFDPEQPTWTWLEETIKASPCDVVVLSSEVFSLLPRYSRIPKKIARFFRKLDFSVQVVAYVRPQHELVNSMYAQRLRLLNSDLRFAKWVPRELSHRIYDYHTLLAPWDRSGNFFLTVLPYNQTVKDQGAVINLVDACGLRERLAATIVAHRKDRRNLTPGPKTVEAYRRLAMGGGRRKYRKHLRELRNFVSAEGLKRGWNDEPFQGVSERMRRRIAHRFAKENEALATLYFSERWNRVFSEELRAPLLVNEFDRRRMSKADEQEIVELVKEAKARFGAR